MRARRIIGLSYLRARVAVLSVIALTSLLGEAAESNLLRNTQEAKQKKEKTFMPMTFTSSSFPQNGVIPPRHTCEGHDTSPELLWTEVPAGTKSLALIVDDPDAPDPAAPKRVYV